MPATRHRLCRRAVLAVSVMWGIAEPLCTGGAAAVVGVVERLQMGGEKLVRQVGTRGGREPRRSSASVPVEGALQLVQLSVWQKVLTQAVRRATGAGHDESQPSVEAVAGRVADAVRVVDEVARVGGGLLGADVTAGAASSRSRSRSPSEPSSQAPWAAAMSGRRRDGGEQGRRSIGSRRIEVRSCTMRVRVDLLTSVHEEFVVVDLVPGLDCVAGGGGGTIVAGAGRRGGFSTSWGVGCCGA